MIVEKRYDSQVVTAWVQAIFAAWGFNAADSQTIAQTIIDTDLHGIASHGVQRVQMYDRFLRWGRIKQTAAPAVVHETDISAVVDGHFAMGQLVGIYSMNLAIQKAKQHGFGIVATRNSNHYGVAGYYANLAADAGLIGFSSTNTGPGMIPTNALKGFLGTDPIGFAMPATPHHFIFDVATTTVPQGKVELYLKEGKDLPALWVAKDGQTPVYSHDATVLAGLRDAQSTVGLVPLGGICEFTGSHKGYGLAMIVEIFTGILAQGNVSHEISDQDPTAGICQSYIALDPSLFGDKAAIYQRFSAYLEALRALPAVPGKRVYVHGDKEAAAYTDRIRHGLKIDAQTYSELVAISKRLGVDYQPYLDAFN